MEARAIQPAGSVKQENGAIKNMENTSAPVEQPPSSLNRMGRYIHQDDVMFKIGISLAAAVLAAAVIVLSGIYADRLTEIIAMRACTGFFFSGVIVFLATLWLDDVGIPLYVRRHAELNGMWVSPTENAVDAVKEEKEEETPQDESSEGSEKESPDMSPADETGVGGESSFAPLDDSVRHLHASE